MLNNVEPMLKAELERQITVWTNKSQIEISSTRSIGDINQGAYLSSAAPQSAAQIMQQAKSSQQAAPAEQKSAKVVEESKSGSDQALQVNLKYDFYQNMTHAFVTYKILKGGDSPSV